MLSFIVTGILTSLIVIVVYYKWVFRYWAKNSLPCLIQPIIPFGTLRVFPLKVYIGTSHKIEYDAGKSLGYKHGGLYQFTKPLYMPIDPEYIKNILQRDFNKFSERGFYHNEKDDPLSANLFAIGGEKWQFIRRKLSPTFTSGKIKLMFDNLVRCANQMHEAINKIEQKKLMVDIKDVAECFTIDVIGSCAFGVECNSFKNRDAEFRKQGRKIFAMTPLRIAKILFVFTWQDLSRWLGVSLFEKKTTDFFINVVGDAIKFRQANNIARNDFLQLLLDLGNESDCSTSVKNKLSIEQLTAQVFIFFAAGFETSSTTLAFCLKELAVNQDIQDKAREEIKQILLKHDGKITYDAIMDMKYVNQVVEETLRKYPPVSFITRVCTEDYTIPKTEVIIEKGTECVVSILGLHRDPEYYPDPDKFDPERFSEENKQQRRPFTYMPFGEGPRICIGLRFGLMQVKVGLSILLQRYKFLSNLKTPSCLEMEPYSFTMIPKDRVFLDVQKVCN